MPIYEYECTKCSERFEVMQKITDGPLRKCRSCGGKLNKLVSRTSFKLKGGGWYAQGYGAAAKPGEKSKPAKGSDKSDTKDSGGKDSSEKAKAKSKAGAASSST